MEAGSDAAGSGHERVLPYESKRMGDENGNNIRFNERKQYPHNDDPFLEGIWEFVRERMDRRERMHRRY